MGTLKKDGDMSGTKKARGGLSLTHLMIRTQVTLIQTDTADKQDAWRPNTHPEFDLLLEMRFAQGVQSLCSQQTAVFLLKEEAAKVNIS